MSWKIKCGCSVLILGILAICTISARQQEIKNMPVVEVGTPSKGMVNGTEYEYVVPICVLNDIEKNEDTGEISAQYFVPKETNTVHGCEYVIDDLNYCSIIAIDANYAALNSTHEGMIIDSDKQLEAGQIVR